MANKQENITLRKELGLIHLIAISMGGLIGTGIFLSPVGILSHVGSVGASLILWILCGICQLSFALCYAELASRIPLSGSSYIYLKVVYGDLIACIQLWSYIISFILTHCVFNVMFIKYVLKPLYEDCEISFYVMKLLYVVTGWHYGQLSKPFEDSSYNVTSYVLAFYSGNWALGGWEFICCVTGEMKHPKRDLRISLIISLGTCTCLYLLANIAYSCVLTKEEMLASPAVAVAFAKNCMGSAGWLMSICIALAVIGSAITINLGTSRIFHMGAKQGHLPFALSLISVQHRTPAVCIIVMGFLSLLGMVSESVIFIMEVSGFMYVVFLALCVLALIILRHKDPHPQNEIVKAPFAVPEMSLTVICFLLIVTIYQRPVVTCFVLLVVFVGFTIIYLLCVRMKKPEKYLIFRAWVTSIIQKWLICLPEDEPDLKN